MNKTRVFFVIFTGIILFIFLWPYSSRHNFELIKEADGISEYKLKSNGLRVLLAKAPYPNLVAIASIYNAGSAQDELNRFGTAHFLEHLTFRGTEKFNPAHRNSIPDILQQAGALFNAQTSNDVTTYYEIVSSDQIDLMLEVEADRMRHVLLSEEDVEREIDVITNEREILQNDSKSQIEDAVWNAAFHTHPYRYPIIGYLESIQDMKLDALKKFYNYYYQPNHLTLAVIGDFDTNRTLSLIKKHYGRIPKTNELPVPPLSEPIQTQGERVVLEKSDTENRIYFTHKSPAGTHPDIPALNLLSRVLTGGTSSRLYKDLVQTGLTLDVESEVSQLRDPGLFIVSARISEGVAHALVEQVILKTYENIKNSGISTAELETAKRQAIAERLFSKNDPMGFIHEMINAIGTGDWALYVSRAGQIESVTADDILRAARRYLNLNQSTVGYLISKRDHHDSSLMKTPKTTLPDDPVRETSQLSPSAAKISAPTKPRARSFSDIQAFKINGASIMLADTGSTGVVHIKGSLNGAGSFYAPNPILAELTARSISTSTQGFDKNGVAGILEQAGSRMGFEADSERLTFSGRCLAQETGKTVELLIKQLREPRFDAAEFEFIKSQLKSALLHEKKSAEVQASSELSRLIYPEKHPFHSRNSQEKLDWLEKTSLDDMRTFYSLRFSPNRLSIVLAGDLDPKKIKDTIKTALSGWAPPASQLPEIQKFEFDKSPKQSALLIPSNTNTIIQFGNEVPIMRRHSDFPALQMANFILGGSSSSRLFKKIRQDLGMAYQVRSFLPGFNRRLQGFWKIQMTVQSGRKSEAIQALRNELLEFKKSAISKTELQKKKAELTGLYRIGLSSSAGLADQILMVHESGLTFDEILNFPKKIEKLTPHDIQAVVNRYFHPEQFNIVTAGGD